MLSFLFVLLISFLLLLSSSSLLLFFQNIVTFIFPSDNVSYCGIHVPVRLESNTFYYPRRSLSSITLNQQTSRFPFSKAPAVLYLRIVYRFPFATLVVIMAFRFLGCMDFKFSNAGGPFFVFCSCTKRRRSSTLRHPTSERLRREALFTNTSTYVSHLESNGDGKSRITGYCIVC